MFYHLLNNTVYNELVKYKVKHEGFSYDRCDSVAFSKLLFTPSSLWKEIRFISILHLFLEEHLTWSLFFLLQGESVDDCGGGYSESIAEMCEELQNGLTPLLIVTPNGRDESGANRDCFLLNPAAKSLLHMNMFRFLGNFSAAF